MSLNYWKRVADLQQQGIFNLELFNFLLLIFLILFYWKIFFLISNICIPLRVP
jgi:hypothetical protein